MKKPTKNDIVFIALMAFVGAGIVAGYAYTQRAQASVAMTSVVSQRNIEQYVDLTGQVEPVTKYDLSFATNGVAKNIYVKEGQSVTQGQILATLDVSDVAMQRAQANAMLIGDQQTAGISLQKAQAAQKTLLQADAQKLAQAKQAVVDAQGALNTAQDSYNNFSKPEDKSPYYATYVSVRQGAVTAQIAYNQARKNLGVLETSMAQAETAAKSDLASAQAVNQLKQNTIDQTGDLSANRANLAYLDAVLSKSTLRAPANGVVTLVDITEGEFATPAKPAITVESNDLQIAAKAAETDIGKLKVGDKATVTFDAFGVDTKFAAHVDSIDTAETKVNGISTYGVTLKFDKDDARILSGMTANVSVVTANKNNVVAVPKQAVITTNGVSTILVEENGKQVKKEITTGIDGADGFIEVTAGLQAGDHIISFSTK